MEAMLAPGFLPAVNASGAYLMGKLSALSKEMGLGEVRGRGLLVALDLKQDVAAKVVDIARDAGVLLNAPRANLLRFMPALNVTNAEIDTMMETLRTILVKLIEK
jgi:acetylornithine/N-succinyldiaminopimelate aminotransferase